MLNTPYRRPFMQDQDPTPPSKNRVVYLIIAVAVVLTTIPLLILVLKGWLSNESTEPVTVAETTITETIPPTVIASELPTVIPPVATPPIVEPTPAPMVTPVAEVAPIVPPPVEVEPTPVVEVAPIVPPPVVVEPTPVVVPPPVVVVAPAPPVPAPPQPAVVVVEPTPAPAPAPAPVATAKEEPKKVEESKTPSRKFRPLTSQERKKYSLSKDSKADTTPDAPAPTATAHQRRVYNEKLYAFVRSNWSAPTDASVGNRQLKAVISLEVMADGEIKSVKFVTPSYITNMDNSVNVLIKKLQNQKAPAPGFNTGTVKIELKN